MTSVSARSFLTTILLLLLLIAPAMAIDEKTTFNVVYTGSTSIRDALSSKADVSEKADYLSLMTALSIKDVKYPYALPESDKTVVTINGYKCLKYYCGYWITATRDGKEVKTDSPVWIYPAPYQIVVGEVEDTKANTVTLTVKEDPKAAAESILLQYARAQPIGKATIGTKL